ncbi:RILP-like protein 1, partial [Lemmus lemmus]
VTREWTGVAGPARGHRGAARVAARRPVGAGEECGRADCHGRIRHRVARGPRAREGYRPARLRVHRSPHAQGREEILKVLVSRHHVAPELDELRLDLDRLRVERMDHIEKERRHPKELELVEDVWWCEAQDLLSQIAQLQEENKQLLTNLNHNDVGFSEEEFQKQEGMSEQKRQVMKRLKEVVDKQRDEILAKDTELGLKNEDVEALQQQQTRLMKINHDLWHRAIVVEAQGKALIEKKVELEADLHTKEQKMGSLWA